MKQLKQFNTITLHGKSYLVYNNQVVPQHQDKVNLRAVNNAHQPTGFGSVAQSNN
jgi:hypothetical protein